MVDQCSKIIYQFTIMLKRFIIFFVSGLSNVAPKAAFYIATEMFSRAKRYNRSPEEHHIYKQATQLNFRSGRVANIWAKNNDETLPIVFLCHGWESRSTAFYELIPQLVNANYKVISWNAPAHGQSPGNKTNLLEMTDALVEDLTQEQLKPVAFVGHSMGGAMLGLLHKYIALPKSVVIISSPTDIHGIFKRYFELLNLSKKTQDYMINYISTRSKYTIDQISLMNSELYKTTQPLIIHDKQDKEIPFEDFLNLQKQWPNGEFYPTEGLGHRRILRDAPLARYITQYILKTSH